MRRIATNGAWERFTLHGTGDKQALGSTKVYKGIGSKWRKRAEQRVPKNLAGWIAAYVNIYKIGVELTYLLS